MGRVGLEPTAGRYDHVVVGFLAAPDLQEHAPGEFPLLTDGLAHGGEAGRFLDTPPRP
jgi:hypothetical protein